MFAVPMRPEGSRSTWSGSSDIDEVDTLLSVTAKARVGHFAKNWERFMDNLLVIGATNEPQNIAPKLLTGRFERKIFVDNPNSAARRNMLMRQLAEEDVPHQLSAYDLGCLVEATAGRSGVNMERLISSACMAAAGLPVSRDHFDTALNAEPSLEFTDYANVQPVRIGV